VAKYAVEAARFLNQQGTQMLVVACNTATALALGKISQAVSIPVIGVVEPGAQRAAAASQNRKAVVIGTEATISSRAYLKALQNLGVEAREKACPLLVPLVEEGWIEHPVTEQIARIYLGEAFADGFESADVLVLGCTHYPLIKPLLRRLAPPHVTIVDSAESTAQVVKDLLPQSSSQSEKHGSPSLQFFATDSVEKFQSLGERFLDHPIRNVQHIDLRE